MLNSVYCFGNTDALIVVLVRIAAKRLKLSAFFPRCTRSEIIRRVAVWSIISYLTIFVNKNSALDFLGQVRRKFKKTESYRNMYVISIYISIPIIAKITNKNAKKNKSLTPVLFASL